MDWWTVASRPKNIRADKKREANEICLSYFYYVVKPEVAVCRRSAK